MDFKDVVYIVLTVIQLLMLGRVWIEASGCGWSIQSKWIFKRMALVIVPVMGLTIAAGWFLENNDELLEWMLGIGMAAMTVAIALHLPAILDSMTDENLAEELNIRMNQN